MRDRCRTGRRDEAGPRLRFRALSEEPLSTVLEAIGSRAMAIDVLQVINWTARRGAEISALELGAALEARGRRVRTVALVAADGDTLQVDALGQKPLGTVTLRRLRRELRTADTVVAWGTRPLAACVLAGGARRLVYSNIGDPRFWGASRLRHAKRGLVIRRATGVVAQSSHAAQALVGTYGVRPNRLATIPTGRPAARFPRVDDVDRAAARSSLGLADSTPVVVVLAALSPEKNVAAAIDAVAELDGVRLVIAGDGPERYDLERLAAERLDGRARFLGVVVRPQRVLAAADVLLLTSRTEGMPGVAIEAGLSGLPVVATDVGAVAEVVLDGFTGRVVAQDDRDALVAALVEALRRRDDFGEAARRHCLARFEIEIVASVWDAFLDRLRAEL